MSSGVPRNGIWTAVLMTVPVLAGLVWWLTQLQPSQGTDSQQTIFIYCAAGMRPVVDEVTSKYTAETGVRFEITYGGSETLLSQIDIADAGRTGEIYIAADDSYIKAAIEKGLVQEEIPLAQLKPVLLVAGGNPKNIRGVSDLLKEDLLVAVGNPDQAAIGRKTRKVLQQSGHWKALVKHIQQDGFGTFLPTVPEVANAVKVGTADAAIIWDATARQYKDLEIVTCPELDAGLAQVTIGILTSAENPAAALKFARYLSAPLKGQQILENKGFMTVPGDAWSERPELVFYAGAVNRKALDPIIKEFADREGVVVNTTYNGCGILTGEMRTIHGDEKAVGIFPDIFMACDVYYLDAVQEWFHQGVNVSETDIVIVVPKGNPRGIQSVRDLTQPDLKLVVGQPKQCTIGVLSRQVFEAEGLTEAIKPNIVAEKPSSAMLVPAVVTGHVDAALAYRSDTLAVADQVEIVKIDSAAAKAIQPYSIAKSSQHKELARRLFQHLARNGDVFREAGFTFRLDENSPSP